MIGGYFLLFFDKIIDLYMIILFINILLSWIAPNSKNEFTDLVYALTEPVLRLFRVVIPIGGRYIDLSPLIVYFILRMSKSAIYFVVRNFFM